MLKSQAATSINGKMLFEKAIEVASVLKNKRIDDEIENLYP